MGLLRIFGSERLQFSDRLLIHSTAQTCKRNTMYIDERHSLFH